MKPADLLLLAAAGGLAIAAFVYWKRSAPTAPTAAPGPGFGGGRAPPTTVVNTTAVFSPATGRFTTTCPTDGTIGCKVGA